MKKHYGGTLISQIKQLQDRIFNKILKEEDIYEFNGQQGRILFSLWKDEKLSLIELSKRTSLAKTTLSSMVERMKEMQGQDRCQKGMGRSFGEWR